MVVICWNRLGQQHAVIWEAGSSILAFEIDVDVLSGAVVHGLLNDEIERKMKQINTTNYCLRQFNSI